MAFDVSAQVVYLGSIFSVGWTAQEGLGGVWTTEANDDSYSYYIGLCGFYCSYIFLGKPYTE